MVLPSLPTTDVMRALADAERVRVVELLSEEPRRAGELASSLGVTPATMSKHLRVLLRAGVVADERPEHDATVRIFRLRRDSVAVLGLVGPGSGPLGRAARGPQGACPDGKQAMTQADGVS